MRVLLINSEHAQLGGAHTVYLNIADMLRRKGHAVSFFAIHSKGELPCPQSVFFSEKRNKKRVFSYLLKSIYNKDAAKQLQKLIDHERPDIAHIHLMWGSLSPSILVVLKKNGIPIVHTVHDYAMICSHVTLRSTRGMGHVCEKCRGGNFCQSIKTRCHDGSLVKSLKSTIEFSYRNRRFHPVDYIDQFVFVTQFCADKHIEMDNKFLYTSKSLLYNVPDSLVEELANETVPNTHSSYYLYYGRLAYEKGVETLIKAFLEMPDLRLIVVGTGPMQTKLESLCKADNSKNISFLGFRTGEELYRIVQMAKYVCAPSEWYENGPMTVIEGFALGTPAIGSRIGAIPELITEGKTGFLFEAGNKESLIQTIRKAELLSEHDYSVMKDNAVISSREKFDRGLYIQKLCSIYESTIANY